MDYSYIIASLPMLRFGEKPLVTLDEFENACGLLSEADSVELQRVLAGQCGEGGSAFCAQWVNADTQLRSELARVRSERAGVEARKYVREYQGYDLLTRKAAEDALAAKNPLDAERMLDQRRWALLDEIAFGHEFELSGVLAYAVKLQIAWRWASLDQEKADQVIEELIVKNLTDEGSMARFLDTEEAAG
jgi:hypothetical protein